ncbi:MAG: hypothetical protein NT075_13320 [Chloroflexi bacterium]|nr:hypothetical protein [Chloroflexota bacterium]
MLQPQQPAPKRDWRVALFALLLLGFLLLSLRFVMTVDKATVRETANIQMTLTAMMSTPTIPAKTTPTP